MPTLFWFLCRYILVVLYAVYSSSQETCFSSIFLWLFYSLNSSFFFYKSINKKDLHISLFGCHPNFMGRGTSLNIKLVKAQTYKFGLALLWSHTSCRFQNLKCTQISHLWWSDSFQVQKGLKWNQVSRTMPQHLEAEDNSIGRENVWRLTRWWWWWVALGLLRL